jgi:nucleoside-diphosphate-sugar epimerase
MGRTILVTGASGALGPHLLTELLRDEHNDEIFVLMRPGPSLATRTQVLWRAVERLATDVCLRQLGMVERVHPIATDIRCDDLGLQDGDRDRLERHVDVVIHAAANTRFTAATGELRDVNVEGTRRVLELARRCAHLQQFLLVSTTCVAGRRTGAVSEQLEGRAGDFLNPYEQTKWEAERLTAEAALPARIARLSTCIGGEHSGYVHRFGAIHQSIRWLTRGLVPMLPAVDGSLVDLIATDVAARWLARAATRSVTDLDVCHVAAGPQAIPIRELVAEAVAHLRATVSGWADGQIEAPVIVDTATFELFERSVAQSGDALFGRVLESTRSFFPALLHPKVYDTTRAEALWGGPLPLSAWRSTLGKVIDFGIARDWRAYRGARERAHA